MLHRQPRDGDTREARPNSYRHLYHIRRYKGDIIAQVLLNVFILLCSVMHLQTAKRQCLMILYRVAKKIAWAVCFIAVQSCRPLR